MDNNNNNYLNEPLMAQGDALPNSHPDHASNSGSDVPMPDAEPGPAEPAPEAQNPTPTPDPPPTQPPNPPPPGGGNDGDDSDEDDPEEVNPDRLNPLANSSLGIRNPLVTGDDNSLLRPHLSPITTLDCVAICDKQYSELWTQHLRNIGSIRQWIAKHRVARREVKRLKEQNKVYEETIARLRGRLRKTEKVSCTY